MIHHGANLADVEDILRWEQSSSTPALWLNRYENHLEDKLRTIVAGSDDECILESLLLLSDIQKRQFLRAHTVAAEILKASFESPDIGWIAKALLAELATRGIVNEISTELWTAYGDRQLDPMKPSNWINRGPVIGETGVLLDAISPFDFESTHTGSLTHLSEAEVCSIEGKLREASSFIFTLSRPAYEFWKNCVDVIAVRKMRASPNALSSSSFARHAGLTVLALGDPDGLDIAELADALLHESIHSFLYTFEEVNGKFVSTTKGLECIFIRSPWTGRDLRLKSYVHACIVWYGVYWLWSHPENSNLLEVRRQQDMRKRARTGFERRPVTKGLAASLPYLSQSAIELLHAIEARMLA